MSNESESESSALENLSALADGELEPAAAARACAAWRDDASVRSTWHAYQLIADVLRSEDLASSSPRDVAFLASLRERLANEPTVLAPDSAAPPEVDFARRDVAVGAGRARGARRSWMAPSAVAAGFVLVAGALIVTRAPAPVDPAGSGSTLAKGTAVGAPMQRVATPAFAASDGAVESRVLVVDGRLIRDARLDRYLAAHKQFAGSSALGVPSGFLRNAAADAPNR